MKNTLLILLAVLSAICSSVSGQTAGTLDLTFNATGKVIYNKDTTDVYNDVKVQTDGKIVAVGTSFNQSFSSGIIEVTRYLTDGSFDPSFGTNGHFTYSANIESGAYKCLIKTNGKILIGGYTTNYATYWMLLIQLNEDGTPDLSFGTNGVVLQTIGPQENSIYALAVQPNGKILAAGYTQDNNYNYVPVILRFSDTGISDTSFGISGAATIPVTQVDNDFSAVSVQSDGKIVAAGHISNDMNWFSLLIARFDTTGNLDAGYGTGGIVNMNLNNVDDEFYDMNLSAGNDATLTGFTVTPTDLIYHLLLMKFDATGHPVTSFGNNGAVISGTVPYTYGDAIVTQPDGKILIAGCTGDLQPANNDWALWRFNSNGSPDTSFEGNGLARTDFFGNSDDALGIALYQNKIILAGKTRNASDHLDFAVARYWNDFNISDPVITNNGSGLASTYSSLANAITALNAATITEPVVITLYGNEIAPAGGYAITQTGGSASNNITINGSNSTINAFSPQTAGNLNDAIFKLVGADWITISGFTMKENAGNSVATLASNNKTEWGIALLYANLTDGCQHNTIQNNVISLDRTYLNTFGIYSNSRHSAANVTTAAEVTAASGSNSFNKVYGNAISNVNYGIVFIGAGTTIVAIDNGNDIGGSYSFTGNTITNWGGGAAPTPYVSLTSGTYCILANQQVNDNISFNTMASATGLATTTLSFSGILKNYTVGQPIGTISSSINSNTVTLTNSPTTGTMTGISNTGITPALITATVSMNYNTILNCSIGAGATSAGLTGIANSSIVGTLNINGNIIRGNTSAAITGGFSGIVNSGAIATTCNINNNQIGNDNGGAVSLSAITSGTVYGISNTSGAVTCAQSISGNNFQGFSYSTSGNGFFRCINQTAKVLSSVINNNNFNNLTINNFGSQSGFLVYAPNGTPTVTINGNYVTTQFSNTASSGTQNTAIYCSSATATTGSTTISGNTLSNISFKTGSTNGAVIYWLNGTGSACTHNILVDGNTISNISNNGTGTAAQTSNLYGIYVGAGNANVISNNNVSNLTAAGGSAIGIVGGAVSTNPAGMLTIHDNIIHDIKSTSVYGTAGGTSVGYAEGMEIHSGPAANNIYRNKIYDISCVTPGAGQAGTAAGIVLSQATATSVTKIYNNYIGRLYSVNSVDPQAVAGIWSWNNGANTTDIYYNTVNLDGSVPAYSYCFLGNSEVPNIVLRNNIFVNNCVPTGGQEQMVYFLPSLTGTFLPTSNNNILYCGTPGPLHIMYADGVAGALTNIQQTLAAFQTFAGPSRESNSKTENVTFANTATGANSNYLHVNPSVPTLAESGAVNIAGITDDYDADVRQGNPGYAGNGTAPDIGADEFAGTPILPCQVPAILTASNITAHAADLGWTETGNATSWDIEWGPTGFTPGSGSTVPNVTNPYNLTGLNAGTAYEFRVRAGCGSSIYSDWTGKFAFATIPGIPFNNTLQNVNVTDVPPVCYDATNFLTVAGGDTYFAVSGSGSATFIAGVKINFMPGTSVLNGGYLHGYISTGTYCGGATPSLPSAPAGIQGPAPVIENTQFSIYPNPTNGNFTLVQKADRLYGNVHVEVYGMRGDRMLSSQTIGEKNHEFGTSALPAGLYFVKIVADNYTETIKLIKTR